MCIMEMVEHGVAFMQNAGIRGIICEFILCFMHVCMHNKCITNHQQNLILLPGISIVAVSFCAIWEDILLCFLQCF